MNNGKTRYGGYKHGDWDDTTSLATIIFIIIGSILNFMWAFYW